MPAKPNNPTCRKLDFSDPVGDTQCNEIDRYIGDFTMDSLASESTVNGSPVTMISRKHAIRIIPKFVTPKKVIVNPYKESKNSNSPDIESKVEEISTKHADTINSKFVTPQKALVNSHKTTKNQTLLTLSQRSRNMFQILMRLQKPYILIFTSRILCPSQVAKIGTRTPMSETI